MTVEHRVRGDGAALTVTVTGCLDMADTTAVRSRLFQCLAEQPTALFVDLAGLQVLEPAALAVFSAVSMQAARWPGIPVLYCAPQHAVAAMLASRAYRHLPVSATLTQARRRAHRSDHSLPSLVEDLIPITGAARQARNVATEACLRWDLPDLVSPASVIAGELVTNVLDHAGTMATLRISLRPRYVMIGVRDGSVLPPQRITPGPSGGRGLLLVDAMAHGWGWLPVDGGKVVWASLTR